MNVLVLCTGNSCRSQMAEGFFKKHLPQGAQVFSAGLNPQGVNPNAVIVMKEVGIDLSMHTSDHLNKYLDTRFDYIITVCDNAKEKCPIFPGGGKRVHMPFVDPADAEGSAEEILDEFRRIRDEIDNSIQAAVKTFVGR